MALWLNLSPRSLAASPMVRRDSPDEMVLMTELTDPDELPARDRGGKAGWPFWRAEHGGGNIP